MTCNYNEYMLHEINQTLAILPESEKELRCTLTTMRDEILSGINTEKEILL